VFCCEVPSVANGGYQRKINHKMETKMTYRNVLCCLSGALFLLSATTTHSATVTVLDGNNGTFHFLDNVSANSFNFRSGVSQTFGAMDVSAAGGAGGTIGAYIPYSGGNLTPAMFANAPLLSANNFTVAPNFFGRSLDAALAQNGPWALGFVNSANGSTNSAVATTQSIANATVINHPTNVSISGSGNMPTFNWTLPANSGNIDAVRIQVWDHQRLVGVGQTGVGGAGLADVVYVSEKIPLNQTSFTLPSTLVTRKPDGSDASVQLQLNGLYSLEISLVDLRDPNGGVGNSNILSRTRSIFDFTFLPPGTPANVFIPNVNLLGPAPIFSFQPISVQAGQQIFIDPLLAVGYDYQIGAGDPNFRTMMLPTGIGDGSYELYLWDNGQWVKVADVQGGDQYDFGANGVDRFRVLGIETSAGLDPSNPTAFITGLSFVQDGAFSGTMTAITVNVPEPGSLALAMLGLALIVVRRTGSGKHS
jgi:hypothetical protein